MEVDLLEDGEGPPDEDGPLHVAPGHVERLDLLLGAHHRYVALLGVVVYIAVVELRDGIGDADLVVLEPHAAEDVGRLLEERVPVDPGCVLDEEATLGHAETRTEFVKVSRI